MMTNDRIVRDRETLGVPLLRRTQEIIEYLQPKVYFMENPYTGSMKDYITEKPNVFDYCMFGFPYRKRTAIWSNVPLHSVMCDGSHLINGRTVVFGAYQALHPGLNLAPLAFAFSRSS